MWKTLRISMLSRWMVVAALAFAYCTTGIGCVREHHDDWDHRDWDHHEHHDEHWDHDHDYRDRY